MPRPLFGITFCALAVAALPHRTNAQTRPLYRNPSAAIDARVADLLKRMTIEEKVAQMEAIAPRSGNGLDSLLQGGDAALYGAWRDRADDARSVGRQRRGQ
jgi:hypothetical protein